MTTPRRDRPINAPRAIAVFGGLAIVTAAMWTMQHDSPRKAKGSSAEARAERALAGVKGANITQHAKGISVAVAGTDIDIDVDGVDLDDRFKSTGFKPFPGTRTQKVNVESRQTDDEKHATVDFTAPAPPMDIIAFYARQLRDDGYSVVETDGALRGTLKDRAQFMLTVASTGSGSKGRLRLSKY